MNQAGEATARPVWARVGVVLLNLLTPGLGLIRIGRLRAGLCWAGALLALLALIWMAAALLPPITADLFRPIGTLLVSAWALWLVGPMVATWRGSRFRTSRGRWSRWYGLLGIAGGFLVASNLLSDEIRGNYRAFYLPSEAMHPTMLIGERFYADMSIDLEKLRRGDVILIRVGQQIYVKRIAGLPGDRIAMRDGLTIINGRPSSQRFIANARVDELDETYSARILAETLPGSVSSFRVLDMGPSRTDDMAEARVPAVKLFVLGDNRDRSADSRVSRNEGGTEMVPFGDVVGRPLFKTWTADWRWLGTPL